MVQVSISLTVRSGTTKVKWGNYGCPRHKSTQGEYSYSSTERLQNALLDNWTEKTRECLPEWRYQIASVVEGRSQWSHGLRRSSAAVRLLRLWFRIQPGGMNVCCDCCVFSGRGLCDELITRPEESCRRWCVVCDIKTSRMRRSWLVLGRTVGEGKVR
jgi:hypothetical protein